MDIQQIHSNLRGFTGGDDPYRHSLARNFYYTPGVKYLATSAHAHWLIDAIASYYPSKAFRAKLAADERLQTLQIWVLEPKDNGAVLKCVVDTMACYLEKPTVLQEIEYTDFPFNETSVGKEPFKLYAGYTAVGGNSGFLLMLPSEY